MNRVYISAIAVIALASVPLVAQKTTRLRHVSTNPELFDSESSSGRSYLGVGISDLNSDRVQALKLKDDRGVEITQVDQDAPAGKAGLKEHDVVVAFNGTPVESAEQFKRLMRETPPGRTVSLDIMRDGQQQDVKVQLADRKKLESSVWPHAPNGLAFATPPIPPMPAMPDFPHVWMNQTIVRVRSNSGATLESLTPQLGDYFGVKNGEGLLVRSVQKGSPADAAGLRAGDVVVRVGDQKITDNSDWTDALRNAKEGKVVIVIMRDKKEQTLSMTVPRKGPDSSALNEDVTPDVDAALEEAANAVESAAPLMSDGVTAGLSAAADALERNRDEINRAINEGMKDLQSELMENRSEIQRNIRESMRDASSELRAHRGDIDKAMRELERSLKDMRIQIGSEMQ